MKRNHNNTTSNDDVKHHKITGDGIGAYTLVFVDGTIKFNPTTSAKSRLLSNLDPDSPVPISQFHVATAHELLTLLASNDNDMSYASHLTPEMYVKILQLCDYLGMDEDISTTLLLHLEPAVQEDPLARLRACHFQLPIFSRILYQRNDTVFGNEKQAVQAVARLVTSSPEHLTYVELGHCDGIHSAKKQHLHLRRFATAERARRQSIRTAAVAKTIALRETLQDAVSKKLLDKEMWTAIEEGRIDVAQKLFDLGADPSMAKNPHVPDVNDWAGRSEMADWEDCEDEDMMLAYPSSLMLATRNNDLPMMRWLIDIAGVDVNLKQIVLDTNYEGDGLNVGGFNALWVRSNIESMQVLLSRGIDPTQKCTTSPEDRNWAFGENISSLLLFHWHNTNDIQDKKKRKLLVRYGADCNDFVVHIPYDDFNEDSLVKSTYWPNLLASKTSDIDMEWCQELLVNHGANSNWPIGLKTKGQLCQQVPVGLTVLMHAVLNDNFEIARLLLQHGADPNQYEKPSREDVMDDGSELYYHPLACKGNELFAAGFFQCPLSIALKKDNKNMIQLLKLHGATADTPINSLETYFQLHPTCLVAAREFRYMTEDMKHDKAFVMECTTKDGGALEFASVELKNDREVVMVAVTQKGGVLYYASDELKNDREVVMHAVTISGDALKCASVELRNDKEIVMVAVKQNWEALSVASNDLKNDKEIVMVAVKQSWEALSVASNDLKNDKEIVMVAVKQSWEALECASNELRNDKEILMVAMKWDNGCALYYASDELKKDKEFIMAVLKQQPMALQCASVEFKNDKEIVMLAVTQSVHCCSGGALEYASDELKNDKEIVMAAVKQSFYALQYASDELKKDSDVDREARNK